MSEQTTRAPNGDQGVNHSFWFFRNTDRPKQDPEEIKRALEQEQKNKKK
jgi:hypothetical protein